MSVALITGAAHGQGRAVALALAEDGYDIVALDIGKPLEYALYAMGSTDELDSLGDEVAALGRECLTASPTSATTRRSAPPWRTPIERFGRIDVLFNNAGICAYGLAHELTEAAWDAMLDINLKGAWIVARRVIPHMIEAKCGVIVNNSSIAGLRGMGRLSHYAASKWGLTGLTKSWAIELAPHGIRVVSIHPTGVDTPLNDGLAAMEGKTPREIAEQSAGNLLPVPWVETSDVAEAVRFLVSEKARYLTGTEFVIDAGLLRAEPRDDLRGGEVLRQRVRLAGPQVDQLRVAGLARGGAHRRGDVVDLRVGERRVGVRVHEAVADAAREPAAERARERGRRVGGERVAVRLRRSGLGRAQERGADLGRARAEGERGAHGGARWRSRRTRQAARAAVPISCSSACRPIGVSSGVSTHEPRWPPASAP